MRTIRQGRNTFRRINTSPAAPRLIGPGVEVTDDGVWSWAQVPPANTYLLEEGDLTRATWDVAGTLASVLPAGADFHLKVLWSRHDSTDYIRSWQSVHSVMAPRAGDFIAMGERRIDRNAEEGFYRRRIVLLGVAWRVDDDTSALGKVRTIARRNLWSPSGVRRDARTRLAEVQPEIDRWFTQLARSPLNATPAPAAVIAWAYARELRRAAIDIPQAETLAGPVLVDLCEGTIDPRPTDHVVVTDTRTGDRHFVTILAPAVNGFPPHDLEVPGGEWLEILTELPGVEASVRGISHGHAGSLAMLDHGRKISSSQLREATANDANVPLEVVDAEETLSVRRHEIRHRQDVMATIHPRWIVVATDLVELRDHVQQVRDRYNELIRLEVVRRVQGLLWHELLPGDRVRVTEFAQHQPLRTLAGSWFHGGSAIGDTAGPYVGANLGSTPGPVQLHLVSRAASDRTQPTTVAVTGRSGSGKSTAVMLANLGALAEGAWALLVDPKGDLHGIVDLAATMLGVPTQVIDVLEPDAAGTMDPLRFCPTADQARTLVLDAMLGALSTEDRRRGETIIENAIDTVLRWPRDAWHAQAVINELRTTPDITTSGGAGRAATARDIGDTLALRAKHPHMRAVLGPLAPEAQPLMTGRGLVYLGLAGLDLPRHNPDPDRWTIAERCSIATFRVSLNYALQLSRSVRSLKKVVSLTELHVLTRHPEGKAAVEWLARTGRALQTWLLLDSQVAVDLAEVPGLVEQIVMSFAFRADGRAEQDAQAVLLKQAEPGPRLRHMQGSLGTGDCIVVDRQGRIAPVHWDLMTAQVRDALSTDAAEDIDVGGPPRPPDPNQAPPRGDAP